MDDLRRLDLNLLLTLHALLAERHVTRAALRLHRSQPAVSHALALLREVFGDPLLMRRGGAMALTPRALELQQPLESALGQLNALLRKGAFDAAQSTHRFRIAMSDYAAHLILPALAGRLRRTAPGVDLAISQSSREAMLAQLADGEIDLALGVFPQEADDTVFETLFEESFVSIADKRSLPPRGQLTLGEWLQRPHVLVATKPDAENEIDAALASKGMRRRIALVLPHWQAATEVLAETDLVLTVARRTSENMPGHRALKRFAVPFELPHFPFRQAWHARRDSNAAHVWLRALVQACCVRTGPARPL
ncbi:LysR family transcriptional regulator [Pseudorhodoferax sp. Leaf274]|uniref:LysR family transcriptional regulator n=1 Tax=Pseudorhodoferax sp. Leaf274 TaxID=1736318 RepID=UPI000702B001|nr:LysR family transcriptional regulator [Pseudorhodoferax sp. Leaf274]KQP49123.1 LysR family transcriptional regulator [Pseudorhodoferax sp. Leaf274]